MSLNSPFHDPFGIPPGPHSKFGECTEGNPADTKSPGDDTSVLSHVLYVNTEGLKGSPAALEGPMGTATSPIGSSFKG